MTESLKLKDYTDQDALEDYGPEDPGNALRALLSKTPAPESNRALDELLYTAQERYVLGELESIRKEDALTVWRLVELSRVVGPEELEKLRM